MTKQGSKEIPKIETQSNTETNPTETLHRITIAISDKMLEKLDRIAQGVGYTGQSRRANTLRHLVIITELTKEVI